MGGGAGLDLTCLTPKHILCAQHHDRDSILVEFSGTEGLEGAVRGKEGDRQEQVSRPRDTGGPGEQQEFHQFSHE